MSDEVESSGIGSGRGSPESSTVGLSSVVEVVEPSPLQTAELEFQRGEKGREGESLPDRHRRWAREVEQSAARCVVRLRAYGEARHHQKLVNAGEALGEKCALGMWDRQNGWKKTYASYSMWIYEAWLLNDRRYPESWSGLGPKGVVEILSQQRRLVQKEEREAEDAAFAELNNQPDARYKEPRSVEGYVDKAARDIHARWVSGEEAALDVENFRLMVRQFPRAVALDAEPRVREMAFEALSVVIETNPSEGRKRLDAVRGLVQRMEAMFTRIDEEAQRWNDALSILVEDIDRDSAETEVVKVEPTSREAAVDEGVSNGSTAEGDVDIDAVLTARRLTLEALSKKRLVDLAKNRGLTTSRKKKAELVDALVDVERRDLAEEENFEVLFGGSS